MASNTVICITVVLLASMAYVSALKCVGPADSEVDCPSDACFYTEIMGVVSQTCGIKNPPPSVGNDKCEKDALGTLWYTCYKKKCNKRCGSSSHQPLVVVLALAVGAYFMSK
uniref:Uncharacterized protein n=1 Tax=Panagrellus redivivus TaxID=6233 RepID=A0A7E4ZTW7_PANRE